MAFRFRRPFRVMPGIQLNLSTSCASTSNGRNAAGLAIGSREAPATVENPRTGMTYAEQSPWSRPTPTSVRGAPGIEVTELPRVEIDIPPVSEPPPSRAQSVSDDDAAESDPLLMPIALLIVALVTVAAVVWATLV
jgi:Protein of unknown function (DUF4236)